MDIQKIKELALANGFKLKEQASGNLDLNAYVYDFANAIEREVKAQAVPEKTVQLHLVWNENKDECVGFLDSKDARYTATGDDRGMFGVTALGDYFRDLNDEHDEFETQIVMIEVQEPAND